MRFGPRVTCFLDVLWRYRAPGCIPHSPPPWSRTETRLTRDRDWITGGSFSPDGSEVVYSSLTGPIYTIDTEGGEPRLLLARTRRLFPDEGRSFTTWVYNPTFSPDGTQIAYFDGMGDWGNSLRVMNADGSGVRVLIDSIRFDFGWPAHLGWSPAGSRLAFEAYAFEALSGGQRRVEGGIWVIGADGSGLTKVIPDGVNPSWSPDGARISYQRRSSLSGALGTLEIATLDGRHVQEFGYAGSGPWNPLPLSLEDSQGRTATTDTSRVAPSVYVIVLLAIVGVTALMLRGRRRNAT